jgi:hypothetical protein
MAGRAANEHQIRLASWRESRAFRMRGGIDDRQGRAVLLSRFECLL